MYKLCNVMRGVSITKRKKCFYFGKGISAFPLVHWILYHLWYNYELAIVFGD